MGKGQLRINDSLILIFFLILFFINGVGFLAQNTILTTWLALLPLVLFSFKFQKNNFPSFTQGILILYTFFSLVSLIGAINLYNSLIHFLFIFLCVGIFIFGTKLEEHNIKFLRSSLMILTATLLLCGFLLTKLVNLGYTAWLPDNGYQLVYSKFGSHNHLGDLIAVVLVLLLTQFSKANLKEVLLTMILVPQFIFSYSRSAYLSFSIGIIAIVINLWRKDRLKSLIMAAVIILCAALIIITTREARMLPFSSDINRFFSNNLNLGDKVFFGTRVLFWGQAVKLIENRPLFGYGAGNYEYALNTVAQNEKLTSDTSHNIIIDVAVEQGVPVALIFCLFLISSFKKTSKKSPYFIAAVVMFVNFLFDYTFKIPGMLLLFFLFLGISIRESKSS